MTLTIGGVLRDAWTSFRRDADLLVRIAGLFLFLPAYAVQLLVPDPPAMPVSGAGEDAQLAWLNAFSDWSTANGGWYLALYVLSCLGLLTILLLRLDGTRPDVKGALGLGIRLLPRFVLATFLVALPAGLGLLLLVLPGLWIMGRTMPVGPAIVAERPLSAIGAIGRGVRLTKGHGLTLTAIAAVTVVGGWIVAKPFQALDILLRDTGAPNPIALAIVDALAAGAASAVSLATVLVQIAVYRQLVTVRAR